MLIMSKTRYDESNSFLLSYKSQCETGEILVGQDMWQQLCNLEEDLRDDRFRFCTEDSNIRIDFIENCCRLTKSPFYNQPMELLLWQKALIETAYSFKILSIDSGEWVDRFLEILLLIARKNGKTELISALELTEMTIGKEGSDIICSGMDDGTSDLAFTTADTMRILMDPKSQDTWRNQKGLKCFATNNHIYKLSDSTRQKEGRNIDFAGIDEVWALTDDGIYTPIQQSTSTKDYYKIFLFGSEGFVDGGLLDKKRKEYLKIVRRESDKDADLRKLPWLYTQDSEHEVWNTNQDGINKAWMKSNPSLGAVKKWSYLKDRVDEGREDKSARIMTLSKDFDFKQNSVTSWLSIEEYDYSCEFDLSEFEGCFYIGGVDLAETTDLCSARIMMMKPGQKEKYIFQHYFIPEAKLEKNNDDHLAGARYSEWIKDGYMTISGDSEVILSDVADWFYMLFRDYKLKLFKVGYDQKFAVDWLKRMEDPFGWTKRGEDADLIMINQEAKTLTGAIKLTEAEFKAHLIQYNNNPVDRWCLSNAGLKIDKNGSLIVKQEPNKRIDGAVTYAIMNEVFRRYRSDFESLVNMNGGNDESV